MGNGTLTSPDIAIRPTPGGGGVSMSRPVVMRSDRQLDGYGLPGRRRPRLPLEMSAGRPKGNPVPRIIYRQPRTDGEEHRERLPTVLGRRELFYILRFTSVFWSRRACRVSGGNWASTLRPQQLEGGGDTATFRLGRQLAEDEAQPGRVFAPRRDAPRDLIFWGGPNYSPRWAGRFLFP